MRQNAHHKHINTIEVKTEKNIKVHTADTDKKLLSCLVSGVNRIQD